MKLCSIASSSSGNCIYIASDTTGILVDVGISKKKVLEGMSKRGISIDSVKAIFITHEHSDHIKGLGVLSRAYKIPIYSTYMTALEIKKSMAVGKIDDSLFNVIEPNNDVVIGDIKVHAFSIYHDAVNPVAYSFTNEDSKVCVATDLGHYDEYIVENLKGSSMLLIESNHDVNMLEVGPYTYSLKQRILSDVGHLSNENCGKLICEIMSDKLKHILLGHLSQENNYPQLAYQTVRCVILEKKGDIFDKVSLNVAAKEVPSQIIIA